MSIDIGGLIVVSAVAENLQQGTNLTNQNIHVDHNHHKRDLQAFPFGPFGVRRALLGPRLVTC